MPVTMIHTIEQGSCPNQKELELLLYNIAGGDKDSLAELYRNTKTAVYAMALSIMKNANDAQDITQDVFVRIWDNADKYRAKGSPMAWILTVTRNLAYMKLRRMSKQAPLDREQWQAIPDEVADLSPEDRHILQEALAVLGDEERRIVMLYAVAGLKFREMASLLEMPLPTVLSKYHRALKKLRALMKGDDTP